MLKKNIPIETIEKVTKLSRKVIEKLKPNKDLTGILNLKNSTE